MNWHKLALDRTRSRAYGMLQNGDFGVFSQFRHKFGVGLSEFGRGMGVQGRKQVLRPRQGDWELLELKKIKKKNKKLRQSTEVDFYKVCRTSVLPQTISLCHKQMLMFLLIFTRLCIIAEIVFFCCFFHFFIVY